MISAAILAATVVVLGWLAAKIFRFGTLMYGNPIQIYAGIEKDPGAVNLLSEKIFTHHRKGGGADLKDLLMEGFQREGAALFLFIGVPEISRR